ncbi:hypothetical protein [Rhodopseudomonas palustris]|uniref:Uncharacterized protein n=1 Tax=Rhodopseudomonas palustris TaxID=1076 RepID=A0A0D7F2H0_RHOPL|nr:hypothetical protein [Rhodopseudomonas palustris]KIZ47244.1 hypothetical protein OO17_05405 [Rhodopseudomonas palustris]MDF3811565.1 hypothetical protein [Rhodopseudomonas sp. BAL398]
MQYILTGIGPTLWTAIEAVALWCDVIAQGLSRSTSELVPVGQRPRWRKPMLTRCAVAGPFVETRHFMQLTSDL